MNVLGEAIALAAAAHAAKVDKSGDPYILHPMRMLMRMRQAHQWNEAAQVVAVLHDVVEDTDVTLGDIADKFSACPIVDRIVEGVDAVTRRRYNDRRKIEIYGEYIVRCCQNSIGRVVKRYDIEDNMDPRRWHPDVPYKRYLWALQYMSELADVASLQDVAGVSS